MYDSTYLIAQEIAEKIQERNRYQRNGESTAKVRKHIFSLSLHSVIFKVRQENPLGLYHVGARFSQQKRPSRVAAMELLYLNYQNRSIFEVVQDSVVLVFSVVQEKVSFSLLCDFVILCC